MSVTSQTPQATDVNGDLYDHLVDGYVKCDDLPIAMAMKVEPIKVDDQNEDDVGQHFCKIEVLPSADVPDEFELRISNSPFTDELDEDIDM